MKRAVLCETSLNTVIISIQIVVEHAEPPCEKSILCGRHIDNSLMVNAELNQRLTFSFS